MRPLPVAAGPHTAGSCAAGCPLDSRPRTRRLAVCERSGNPRLRLPRVGRARALLLKRRLHLSLLGLSGTWRVECMNSACCCGSGDLLSTSTQLTIYQTLAPTTCVSEDVTNAYEEPLTPTTIWWWHVARWQRSIGSAVSVSVSPKTPHAHMQPSALAEAALSGLSVRRSTSPCSD